MKQTGWRKPTPGLGVAEQLAQAGERIAVPKSTAFVAVKRVAAHIGLKAGDLLLLDTLGAFTQPQDWAEGQRPIVWASNAYLMERTGFSLSALKRHARRLAEAGLVSFRDSPNGKRWGRRNDDGMIVEAYGFDLSPLAVRAKDFERLHAELQAERALCLRLKRQITVSRRVIRARIEAAVSGALRGPWAQLATLYEDLLERLPRRPAPSGTLQGLMGAFRNLQDRVEAAYLNAFGAAEIADTSSETAQRAPEQTREMDPKAFNSEPHIQDTNELHPVTCKSSENEQEAHGQRHRPAEDPTEPELQDGIANRPQRSRTPLNLQTVMQACPEFLSWVRTLGAPLKDWDDLHRAAGQLRPMIGVSDHAWGLAQDRLGSQIATAALVLTFDKHVSGEVASSSGYLRGMVRKAGAGELHLERSFYGRLSRQAA